MQWLQLRGPPLLMIIGGVITWFIKSRVEELRAAEEKLREDRLKAYSEILTPFIQIFADAGGKYQEKAAKRILSLEYRRTAFELTLFGSDEVVMAWNSLMQYIYANEQYQAKALLVSLGRMLLEIRKSLGNKKSQLKELDMLRWLIKDIDEIERQST